MGTEFETAQDTITRSKTVSISLATLKYIVLCSGSSKHEQSMEPAPKAGQTNGYRGRIRGFRKVRAESKAQERRSSEWAATRL